MYCNRCGKELIDGTRFCPGCGKEISTRINNANIRKPQNIRNERQLSDRHIRLNRKVLFAGIGIFAALIIISLLIYISYSSSYIGKGIRFGMSENRVSEILNKSLPTKSAHSYADPEKEMEAKNKGLSEFGVPKYGQIDAFRDYYGSDISPYVTDVVYYFKDDKLSLVQYILETGEDSEEGSEGEVFTNMQEACEAFGIRYNKDNDEEDGYYACYTKGIYAEFHPFSGAKYPVDLEYYYVYFEPTYKPSLFGKLGHKHKWEMPTCDDKKICKSCGEESKNYRQHILDDMGFCVVCGENGGIPLTDNNLKDYFNMTVDGRGGIEDGTCYIDYEITVSPIDNNHTFNPDTSLYVTCDFKYDDHPQDNETGKSLCGVTIDETGNGKTMDRRYNVNVLENFLLRCHPRGRVYNIDRSVGSAPVNTTTNEIGGSEEITEEPQPSEDLSMDEYTDKNAKWTEAYKQLLNDPDAEFLNYSLIYLDNDEIPEIIMYDKALDNSFMKIATYKDGRCVVLYPDDYAIYEVLYIEKSGLFYSEGGMSGFYPFCIYKLDNGNFERLAYGNISEMPDGEGELKTEYYLRGNKTTSEEYHAEIDKYIDLNQVEGSKNWYSKEEINKILDGME